MTVIDGGALAGTRRSSSGAKTIVGDPISTDLKRVLRQLKLARMLDTLPERITLAKQQHLSHVAFLALVLADEATRRDTSSAARRARTAGLDPGMRLDTWDETAAVRYDRTLWAELTSLRFLDGPHGACVLDAPLSRGRGQNRCVCAGQDDVAIDTALAGDWFIPRRASSRRRSRFSPWARWRASRSACTCW